jgi:hypothetical protein
MVWKQEVLGSSQPNFFRNVFINGKGYSITQLGFSWRIPTLDEMTNTVQKRASGKLAGLAPESLPFQPG